MLFRSEKLLKYDRDSSIGLDGKQVDDGKWIGRNYIIGEDRKSVVEGKTHNQGSNICPKSKFLDELAIPES